MSVAQKLSIVRGVLAGRHAVFHPGSERIEVLFNPTEYSISAQNGFGEAKVVGLTQPVVQFGGGQARSLQFELLADTYTYHNGRDIRSALVARLEDLLEVDPFFHSPPPCKVVWGIGLSFIGVLEGLDARYVFFLEDATPVRARLSLRFKEYLRDPAERVRAIVARVESAVLEPGETLSRLAERATGDARRWRDIATNNDIDNPRRVPAGVRLRMGER